MDAAARVTSKGQITVPKSVRDALQINEGDQIVFRVDGDRAVLTRSANFLDLAAAFVAGDAGRCGRSAVGAFHEVEVGGIHRCVTHAHEHLVARGWFHLAFRRVEHLGGVSCLSELQKAGREGRHAFGLGCVWQVARWRLLPPPGLTARKPAGKPRGTSWNCDTFDISKPWPRS